MTALLTALHAVAASVWVGGIFFAYLALRPAAMGLEPPQRLPLWRRTLGRFFPVVWVLIGTLLVTGHGLMHLGARGPHVHAMLATGWLMAVLFAYLYFGPFRRLVAATDRGDLQAAGQAMARARPVMAINLALGLFTVAAGASGRWL